MPYHSKFVIISFFLMSYFDPYYLYSHPQKKSHKGQVIQKKPTDVPYGFNESDLRKAITVLTNYGYYISKNPIPARRLTLAYSVQVSKSEDSKSHTYSTVDFLQIDNSIRNVLLTTYPFLSSLQSATAINIIIQVPHIIFSHSTLTSQVESIIEFADVPHNSVVSFSFPANYGPVYNVIRSGNSTGTAMTLESTLANYSLTDPMTFATLPNVLPAHIGGIIFNSPYTFDGDQANAFLSYLKSGTIDPFPESIPLIRIDTNQGVFSDSVATACLSVEIVI